MPKTPASHSNTLPLVHRCELLDALKNDVRQPGTRELSGRLPFSTPAAHAVTRHAVVCARMNCRTTRCADVARGGVLGEGFSTAEPLVSPEGNLGLPIRSLRVVPVTEFPWFGTATIEEVMTVERPAQKHLFRPMLDGSGCGVHQNSGGVSVAIARDGWRSRGGAT